MADDFTIKQNDLLPELIVTLTDSADSEVNVSNILSITFKMSNKLTGEKVVDAPAEVVDGPGGIVKYVWVEGDTAVDAPYKGEFEVVFADGKPETFPNGKSTDAPTGYIRIKVFPDLDGS